MTTLFGVAHGLIIATCDDVETACGSGTAETSASVPDGLGSTEPLGAASVAARDPLVGTEGLTAGVLVPPTEWPLHAVNIAATATQPNIDLDVRTGDTSPTC